MDIIRTWKSDGSVNVMDLARAAATIHSARLRANIREDRFRPLTELRIREMLEAGCRVETPLAVFTRKADGA